MPKGYWMGHVRVTDPAGYARYREANAAAFGKYGGRFLVRGGAAEEVEGALGRERHVIIEFPSYQAALDCWNSPEYAAAKAERDGAGEAYLIVVEGVG
ncbi:DUF1330 domain-containing protein [Paralimibaculum aggregatum]|uniref:DUF1330 domain-containing protein n=1 Tax=Paralimibaculum aggregatum TaxID=3036245 RepID=A0ABQ6LHX8_9RHOB|nr:DUF1330 domain-containing protein [Limibaculum sp. NKW23]GMG82890.1 DUF1330 domain-containing protein [Limibaculum sp. NKW23]